MPLLPESLDLSEKKQARHPNEKRQDRQPGAKRVGRDRRTSHRPMPHRE